jgi:hypothetical protein
MKILSIDCGIVSMSLSLVNVKEDKVLPLCLVTTDLNINKNNLIERIDGANKYINNVLMKYFKSYNCNKDIFILIEKQIPSTITYDIMIVLYSTLTTMGYANTILVDPRLKNKYKSDIGLEEFALKYMSKYSANKAFAVYNFEKKLKELDFSKTKMDYPAKYKKDIADSFMQIYGWLNTL